MEFTLAPHQQHLIKSVRTIENGMEGCIKGSVVKIIEGDFGYFRMEIIANDSFIICRLRANLTQSIDIIPFTTTPISCWYATLRGVVAATLAGKGSVTLKEQEHRMYFIPANGANTAKFPIGEYEAVYVSFSTAFLDSFIKDNQEFHEIYDRKCKQSDEGTTLPEFDLLLDVCDVLQTIFNHDQHTKKFNVWLDLQVRNLLFHYFEALLTKDVQSGIPDPFKRLKDHIDSNIGANLRINTMSKSFMFMSRGRLNQLFEAKMGIGIKEYIRRELQRKAEYFLSSCPKMTIAEIAFTLGYNEPSYFSTLFKQWTGMRPSDYRKGSASNAA